MKKCHSTRNSRLDPSQVEDRRGRRGTGTVIAVGGGGLGLILTIVSCCWAGILPARQLVMAGKGYPLRRTLAESTTWQAQCQTGADANTREDCRIVGFVNSIQSFWTDEFAQPREPVHTRRYSSFHGVNGGRLWICQQRNGAILLSDRPESLSGPRLLQ